jgi:hypothetical protein
VQITKVLKDRAAGTSASNLCRKHGIMDAILQRTVAIWRELEETSVSSAIELEIEPRAGSFRL